MNNPILSDDELWERAQLLNWFYVESQLSDTEWAQTSPVFSKINFARQWYGARLLGHPEAIHRIRAVDNLPPGWVAEGDKLLVDLRKQHPKHSDVTLIRKWLLKICWGAVEILKEEGLEIDG